MNIQATTQTIVKVLAGQMPNMDQIKLILEKQKPTHFGFAIQDGENKDNVEIALERMEGCLDLDQIAELCENAKPWPMLLAFSHLVGEHTNDDIQPFIINDPDGNATFAVTIEGDFPHFADSKSGHGETYNFFKRVIEPEIVQLCEDLGDPDKVNARIAGDKFMNNTFLLNVGHRGVMDILPLFGDVVSMGKNELGATYDWGTVSQRHTFGDKVEAPKVEAAAPAVEKKKGWFSGKKENVISDPKGQATPGTGERTSGVPEVTATNKVEQTAVSKKKERALKPPNWVHKNDDIKNWYTAVHGSVPGNWKKRIPVVVYNEDATTLTSNDEVALYLAKKNIPASKTAAAAPQQTAQQQKAAVQNLEKHIEAEQLPIIPAADLNKLIDFVAKHVDTNSQEIGNPATMQQREAELKIPTLSESLGLGKYDLINISPAAIFALFKTHPEAGALFAIEMRNNWRATVDMKDLVGTKPTDKPADTPADKPVETPETKPEAAPAAKKGGWFGRKAA